MFLSTIFSKSLSLRSIFNVRTQVSQRCKIRDRIINPYLFIFILFDNKQQDKIFGSNSSKNSAIVFSFKFRFDSDVWLTVHRNSVWIRKTN